MTARLALLVRPSPPAPLPAAVGRRKVPTAAGRGQKSALRRALVLVLVVLAPAAGCRGVRGRADAIPEEIAEAQQARRGVLHPVAKGQTLWRIARVYGVTVQDLAEINDVADPAQIAVGQALWIPGADRVLEVPPAPQPPGAPARAPPPGTFRSGGPEEEVETPVVLPRGRFAWPVQGVVFSRFGVRGGVQHDGIDIAAPQGTPVLAADAGEVLFAGERRGYGNLVLLRHADELITVYAHNARNLVAAGARVRRGEVVAEVGRTGRATGPHLHFEVRKDRLARNPLFYLP